MSKIPCSICLTSCVWCRWICKCWYKVNQAKQSNELLVSHPGWRSDKEILKIVIKEIKAWHANDVITKSIVEGIPLRDIVYPKAWSIYCEYPVGSWGKWMWVECLKCSKPRFEWIGKLCSWKEIKEDVTEEEILNPNEWLWADADVVVMNHL